MLKTVLFAKKYVRDLEENLTILASISAFFTDPEALSFVTAVVHMTKVHFYFRVTWAEREPLTWSHVNHVLREFTTLRVTVVDVFELVAKDRDKVLILNRPTVCWYLASCHLQISEVIEIEVLHHRFLNWILTEKPLESWFRVGLVVRRRYI